MDQDGSLHEGFSGSASGGNGLGSLADELADAEDDVYDEDEEQEGYGDEVGLQSPQSPNGTYDFPRSRNSGAGIDSSAIGIALSTSSAVTTPVSKDKDMLLSPDAAPGRSNARGSRHRRVHSVYDGSDYGDDSDLEASEGISPGLEAKMAAVESLARRGSEENGSPTDEVVQRVMAGLRDLGDQTGVEGGVTRLSTAHNSLTTHLTHQTRLLTSLTSTLFSPLSLPPSPDDLSALLPLLTTLLATSPSPLPYPSSHPSPALYTLSSSTQSLLASLAALADSLQLARQTTNSASRALRNTQQVLAEVRRELDAAEEGRRWIEKGKWEERLERRDCARECEGVVGGFEEVCRGWRERLMEGAATAV
ncbi:MAG: hypothetical protein Q9165_003685 [Trypethelium subeluteriae]